MNNSKRITLNRFLVTRCTNCGFTSKDLWNWMTEESWKLYKKQRTVKIDFCYHCYAEVYNRG